MKNEFSDIVKATSENEISKSFSFFQKMWLDEFDITLTDDTRAQFSNSDIFYIEVENTVIWTVQIITIDEKRFQIEPSLRWVAKLWEKVLGRIWVLEAHRGKQIGSKLIKFVIQYYREQWEKNIFLPSAIQNLGYYERFGFHWFSEPKDLGNTQVVMMRKKLVNE